MPGRDIKSFLEKHARVLRGGILLLAALGCLFVFSQRGHAEDETAVTSSSCGSVLSCLSILLGQVQCACNCPIANHGTIQSLIFREHMRTMYYFGLSVPADIAGALLAALPTPPSIPFLDKGLDFLKGVLGDLLGNVLNGLLAAFGANLPIGLGGVPVLTAFINPPPPDTDPVAVYPFDPPAGEFYKEGANRIFKYQNWMIDVFFRSYVNQLFETITQQMTTAMMHQAVMIGAMMDAKNQLETQALMQRLVARAHKDYHPSMGMCEFGTIIMSMGPSDNRMALAKGVMDEGLLKRQLGSRNINASEGKALDRKGRLSLFKWRFCFDPDNNRIDGKVFTGLGLVCDPAEAGVFPNPFPDRYLDQETDFTNSVALKRTILYEPGWTDYCINGLGRPPQDCIFEDDHAMYAMSELLYGHDVFDGVPSALLVNEDNWDEYLDMRSVIAKRAVAAEPFHSIVGLKSFGTGEDPAAPGSQRDSYITQSRYIVPIFESLGMTPSETATYLGSNPSYMAFLEVMSKKMYQRPQFYTELYDTPANIERKSVAMQAISLILDRDIYESYLRSESVMALILEAKLEDAQKQVENKVNSISSARHQ